MRALEPADVLTLWEGGAQRHALDRAALLAAFALPEIAADTVADLPLGEITASLLRLREASFGSRFSGHVDCESCGERLELELDVRQLLRSRTESRLGVHTVDVLGVTVRAPTLRDLAELTDEQDSERAARRLLERCTISGDTVALSEAALLEVDQRLEALDPNADLAFTVHCEACGNDGMAQLDA